MSEQIDIQKSEDPGQLSEAVVIHKPGTPYYLVDEDGTYLWGNKEDAIVFDQSDEAEKIQKLIYFETKLECV